MGLSGPVTPWPGSSGLSEQFVFAAAKRFFPLRETLLRRGTFLNSVAGQEPGTESKAGHVQTGREVHTSGTGVINHRSSFPGM